jgi:flagellar export protein FliJ
MKSRETLIRLKRFEVDEKRRRVADIEMMIADFERLVTDLDEQIQAEQDRAGIHDVTHFAYPTFAKAALQRRDNLKQSIEELKQQMEAARDELADAFEELKKVELIEEKEQARERKELRKREGDELDAVGLAIHRSA